MKFSILTAVMLAAPLIASAALPPQYQRQRELVQIVESEEVGEALAGQPIDEIITDGHDTYTVRAGRCSVQVMIVDVPPRAAGWVGPRQFSLQVGEPSCAGNTG